MEKQFPKTASNEFFSKTSDEKPFTNLMSRFKRSRIQMIRLSVTGRWWINKCTDESRYLQQRHWHHGPGGKLISVEEEGEFNSIPFHPQQQYSRSLWGFFGDNIHAWSASVWSIPAMPMGATDLEGWQAVRLYSPHPPSPPLSSKHIRLLYWGRNRG